jgi:hypothetical protein
LGEAELLDRRAAREGLDPGDDLGPVEEKLIADDGMAGVDLQAAALIHPDGVGVGGVRRPDDLRPLLSNRLLRCGDPDPMLRTQGIDQFDQFPGRSAPAAGRIFRRDAP